MDSQHISALLASLTGQLQTTNSKDLKVIDELQTQLANTILQQDPSSIRQPEFTFERSDTILRQHSEKVDMKQLKEISKAITKNIGNTETRLFVRNIPIRSTQIPRSINNLHHGVRVNTIGPIRNNFGIPNFLDFIKVKKLIALYVQGQTTPTLLFDATFKTKRVQLINEKPVELVQEFTIDPESVWIRANLFAAATPANLYCPIRVKGGKLSLSKLPFLDGGKLTIDATTEVNCVLNMEQNDNFEKDATSPYGKDARAAQFNLPENFEFRFTNNNRTILSIGNSKWKVYGQENSFKYTGNQLCVYNPFLNRIAFVLECEQSSFEVSQSLSPFYTLQGKANIKSSWWTLPLSLIDVNAPLEADGNGAIVLQCAEGLQSSWLGLENKQVALSNSFILGEPGRIGLTDLKSNGLTALHELEGWKDELNSHGTSLQYKLKEQAVHIFNTTAKGDELLMTVADVQVHADRPVKVNGEAVEVRTKGSVVILGVSKYKNQIIVLDENMLWDNKLPADKIPHVTPIALAMHNALFTTTPANSLILFATCDDKFSKMLEGKMYLGFGLYSYLPTLPDPYAANLGILKSQFEQRNTEGLTAANVGIKRGSRVWMWLVSLCKWELNELDAHKVGVSFHFAPLLAPLQVEKEVPSKKKKADADRSSVNPLFHTLTRENVEVNTLDGVVKTLNAPVINATDNQTHLTSATRVNPLMAFALNDFALLDVSSKANQMGVAFAKFNNGVQRFVGSQFKVNIKDDANATLFPIQVEGLDVVTAGMNAKAFTLPAISWEPVFNLTSPETSPGDINSKNNSPFPPPFDPPVGFNYYTSDGFPTIIGNLSKNTVALSPIPLAKYLVNSYQEKEDGRTYAFFNLPFGMIALSVLDNGSNQNKKPTIDDVMPVFENYVNGGLQFELTAGSSPLANGEDNLFEGFTFQVFQNNLNNANGFSPGYSTLGRHVTTVLNKEFGVPPNVPKRGVPVTKMDLSGYGTSMFSNWANDKAFASVSKAQFNVITGRTSREVVQIQSVLYPMAVKVVRTITIFRMANGYVARVDSGWQKVSDGKYDFDHFDLIANAQVNKPFTFHPGLVRGVYNVRNIREADTEHTFQDGVDEVILRAVTYDADVELENITEGGENNRVPAKGIVGFVQLSPVGKAMSKSAFQKLMSLEGGSIGGPINATMKIAGTEQHIKLDRFDVSTTVDAANNPIFVAAARGSILLPKDGSWSMVQHSRKNGDVSPLPEKFSIPLIRIGEWINANDVISNNDITKQLVRLANPADLLRNAVNETINYGLLQNMGTQKVLFMTPAFKKGVESLVSKTPPLLADSFRLLKSSGIFPNIGNIENDFGQAISMLKGVVGSNPMDAFSQINLPDGSKVFDLLKLQAEKELDKVLDQGYKLMKGAVNGVANELLKFDLPSIDYPLIDKPGMLVVRLQYKASSKPTGQEAPTNYVGKMDFDIDSFANDLSNTWKGRMNNLAIVVSLGPLTDLMTIKGNFNSQKGKETDLGSKDAGDSPALNLPTPEIEFSDAVEPVIKILEILASLSSGEYGEALKKGLKVAMSNSANIWEYKFEASKDIPLVRFPPTKALYDAPTTPLKLEASLGIGVFFNAALKITTDPKQLLPSAGAFFKFHGGLQVMCLSVGVGTIFAVGNVDLKLEADTRPLIAVTMKFGFGAQLTVGLPVVATVSVLFMIGTEIYADSGSKVRITAFMLFRGQADILGGIVSVTITIEAKGAVEKAGKGLPCNCIATVTFAIDISIFLIIDISFSESWEETRQIA